MAINAKISAVDVNGASYAAKTTVVGQEEVPMLSVEEMQQSVEYMPRNLLAPKINEIVNAVNESYSKAEADAAINQKVAEIGTGDMAQAVYDPSGTVRAAGGVAAYVNGKVDPAVNKINNELANSRYVGVVLRPEWWQGNSAPYTYTISVPGMTAGFIPGIPWHAVWQELTEDELRHRLEEMAKIYKVETADGRMVFTADEKPDCALNLRVSGEVYSGIFKSDY